MKQISVIIPSYNSFATVGRTLDALAHQTRPPHEVIVADSSDDVKTAELLSTRRDANLHVVRLKQKTMPAAARNAGVRAASGNVLAFIDADAYPAADWIEKIMASAVSGVRAGGGSVLLPEFQSRKPIAVAQHLFQFNEFIDRGAVRIKQFIPSCNFFCDGGLFADLGGFPEIRASEDVLFGFAVNARTPVVFDPSIRVYHVFRETWGPYLNNQRLLGRYILIYRRGHYHSWIYRGALPVFLAPFVAAVKFLRIACRIAVCDLRTFLSFVLHLPWISAGLAAWTRGYAEAAFMDEDIPASPATDPVRSGRKVVICGTAVDAVSMKEAVRHIADMVERRAPSLVMTPNVHGIVQLNRDAGFRGISEGAQLILPDGMPLLWAAAFLGTPLKERVAGSDLLIELCRAAPHRGHAIFFLGARPGVAQKAAAALKDLVPGLNVCGTFAPSFNFEDDPEECARIVQAVRAAKPDILFVGLGSPKQERFIDRYKMDMGVPVAVSVGASFDFASGEVRRAPVWMRRCGFEWLWRMCVDPARLWKRYLVEDPVFFWYVFRQKMRSIKERRSC